MTVCIQIETFDIHVLLPWLDIWCILLLLCNAQHHLVELLLLSVQTRYSSELCLRRAICQILGWLNLHLAAHQQPLVLHVPDAIFPLRLCDGCHCYSLKRFLDIPQVWVFVRNVKFIATIDIMRSQLILGHRVEIGVALKPIILESCSTVLLICLLAFRIMDISIICSLSFSYPPSILHGLLRIRCLRGRSKINNIIKVHILLVHVLLRYVLAILIQVILLEEIVHLLSCATCAWNWLLAGVLTFHQIIWVFALEELLCFVVWYVWSLCLFLVGFAGISVRG